MAATCKRPRSQVSHCPRDTNTVDLFNLSDDHDFIVPNEVFTSALGLLHSLTTRRLINTPFSALYLKSLKYGWDSILTRERQSLRSNPNSVEKCFVLNRLLTEYSKDPEDFVRRARDLFDEITTRMSNTIPSSWNLQDLYQGVQGWRELQCKRRLFYVSHDEIRQLHSFLFLQRAATEVFNLLLTSKAAKSNTWHSEEYKGLIELLRHSLIIVAQPTSPDCLAATKYDKTGQIYTAKLHTRIICLLHPDVIRNHLELSKIGVTLHLLNDQPGEKGEIQSELEWQIKEIASVEGASHSFLYAEFSSLQMSRLDSSNRLAYNFKLCRLKFNITVNTTDLVVKEELRLESQPFALCSHAQYFPELVAQVIIFECEQLTQNTGSVISPDILMNFMRCYYTRVSGVEPKSGTCRFILSVLQAVRDCMCSDTKKECPNITSSDVYKEILGKLISQIDFLVDHPCMAMMYHDGLFLGVSDSRVDEQLSGSQERPHICVRFNSLQNYPSTQSATVRYIVHDGQLTKATFQMRAFADEMCGFVYEATQDRAAQTRLLSEMPDRTYHGFSLYFDDELFRLSTITPDENKGYKPMIPVLWKLMRRDDIVHPQPALTDADNTSGLSSNFRPRAVNTSSTFRSHMELTIPATPSVTIISTNASATFNEQQNKSGNFPSGEDLSTTMGPISVNALNRIANRVFSHPDIQNGDVSSLFHSHNAQSNGVVPQPTNTTTDDIDFDSLLGRNYLE